MRQAKQTEATLNKAAQWAGVASNRAGAYVRQTTGYHAFTPTNLPPSPPIRMDALQTLLSRADRALGRLDGAIHTLPDPDLFVFMYVRKEAVLSSQIEGTQSSLHDILEAEAKILNASRPDDLPEVLNYIKAMNYGLDRLSSLPISQRLIREIHQKLMEGVRGQEWQPGEIRTSQNWIGPQNCTLQQASFVPPPPNIVPEALGDLEKFIHGKSEIPDLVKLGIVHAQFETIHPFLDGNGRVGRLLITLQLCESEILLKPVLYLSYYFKANKDQYYAHLQAIRDKGDWEAWLVFFLKGVAGVANEASELCRTITQLRERDREKIIGTMGRAAGNGLAILEMLYKNPIVQVKDVQNRLGMSFAGANGIVQSLLDAGLLHETTGQKRHRRFIYLDYVSLFAE